jgi:long-chain acyl-CoA synthetase
LEGDAKKGKLFGFEKIRKLYISPVSFGDNDLLTTTFKLKRNKAKEFYKEILDNLYQD